MRIAIVSEWLAEPMGYIENLLPPALAELGHEVHLIAGALNPPFPHYNSSYEPFLGPRVTSTGHFEYRGTSLYRTPAFETPVGVFLPKVGSLLRQIQPDVVQALSASSPYTVQCVRYARRYATPLFVADHWSKSVFKPNAWRRGYYFAYRSLAGPYINRTISGCFIPSPEIRAISTGAFGISNDLVIDDALGVDTKIHHPVASLKDREERVRTRQAWGCSDEDIVCVYTGRTHTDKGPEVLARAVELARGTDPRIRAIFLGPSTEEERRALEEHDGVRVLPPVAASDLGVVYRASDLAVWPKQESTSMLDATACGLPVVVGDHVFAPERRLDARLVYRHGDEKDLARILLELTDSDLRIEIGLRHASIIHEKFSWSSIAERRSRIYGDEIRSRSIKTD